MSAPIPDYSKVSLLLPMSGANNGATFTDRSPTPKSVTRFGDTETRTALSKYYGSSAYFDGLGDYLRIDPVADDVFGLSAFTVEGYFHPTAYASAQPTLFGFHSSSGANRLVVSDRSMYGSSFPTTTYSQLALNAWVHVAMVRASSSIRLYIEGMLTLDFASTIGNDITATDTFTIGQEFDSSLVASDYFNGYVQDVCVTLAEKYTSNFTPPTRMIGEIGGNVLDDAGNPAARSIVAFPRTVPAKFVTTTSSGGGTYSITNMIATDHAVIYLDDDSGTLHNDLVQRVIPA